jgi:S-adenosylmethionine:tRNA ribosyltransferase-isomerase
MDPRHIHISDYNYQLPDERIARFPLPQRDTSKLLVYRHGTITDDNFFNLPDYLPHGALMVFNNTKVIQARMHFRKDTGALIEVFLLEPFLPHDYEQMFQSHGSCSWICLVGNAKKWKEGQLVQSLDINGLHVNLSATRQRNPKGELIRFEWDNTAISFAEIIDAAGELPIPPYLNRKTQESDKTTYQTVYSKIKGSVAAPTAGLHFTDNVLRSLDNNGIIREEVTLHVGAGTFKPVKSEEIEGHEMHTEYICVRKSTLEKLLQHNCQAIAVGTTSVRTLESLYYMGVKAYHNPDITEDELHIDQWMPYGSNPQPLSAQQAVSSLLSYMECHSLPSLHSSTQVFIAPGYDYKIVKMLITNFHQPQSTLLLLVSAFVHGDWKTIYSHALANDYRFLSYGDSSLLIP